MQRKAFIHALHTYWKVAKSWGIQVAKMSHYRILHLTIAAENLVLIFSMRLLPSQRGMWPYTCGSLSAFVVNEQGLYFTRGMSRPWGHHKEKESVNSSSIPRWGLRKFLKVGLWTAVVDYRNDPNSLPSLEPYPLPCRSEVSSHHLLIWLALWFYLATRLHHQWQHVMWSRDPHCMRSLGSLPNRHVNTPELACWMVTDTWPSHFCHCRQWPPDN